MAAKKQEVVKKDDAALAVLYEEDAGAGFEETTSDDYALPFLKLLQKMSPECDSDDGAYVEGAKPGMYYDTATGELLDEVEFVPCHYHRAIVEWRDRDDGGGFVAQHEPGYEAQFERDDTGRHRTPDGTYLADTRYFFGLRVASDGDPKIGVISFTSTQLKKSRNWLTKMQNMKATGKKGRYTLPMFANVWRLTSVPEENEKGSWRGYKIELVGPIQDADLARAAKDARDMFRTAATRIKPPSTEQEEKTETPF